MRPITAAALAIALAAVPLRAEVPSEADLIYTSRSPQADAPATAPWTGDLEKVRYAVAPGGESEEFASRYEKAMGAFRAEALGGNAAAREAVVQLANLKVQIDEAELALHGKLDRIAQLTGIDPRSTAVAALPAAIDELPPEARAETVELLADCGKLAVRAATLRQAFLLAANGHAAAVLASR